MLPLGRAHGLQLGQKTMLCEFDAALLLRICEELPFRNVLLLLLLLLLRLLLLSLPPPRFLLF